MVSMPLITIGLWSAWYRTTFTGYNSPDNNNYSALANLYGKAGICKEKNSLLGQYALMCTSIYKFCSTAPPNIEEYGDSRIDKTEDCKIYMNATKPFRYLFIPTIISSLIISGIGIALLVKASLSFAKK